jgi:hypothetical protein
MITKQIRSDACSRALAMIRAANGIESQELVSERFVRLFIDTVQQGGLLAVFATMAQLVCAANRHMDRDDVERRIFRAMVARLDTE